MRQRVSTQTSTAHPKDLQQIPGVGPSLAQDLWDLGYRSVASLANQDAEAMYTALVNLRGQPMDRCVLYVFRCAVYFASTDEHDPALLKWWNWKTLPLCSRSGSVAGGARVAIAAPVRVSEPTQPVLRS